MVSVNVPTNATKTDHYLRQYCLNLRFHQTDKKCRNPYMEQRLKILHLTITLSIA